MTLIAVALIFATMLYQAFSLLTAHAPPTATDVAGWLVPRKEIQKNLPEVTGAELQHRRVVLSTAFTDDWSVRTDGSKTVFAHKDNASICQSHVGPVAEFDEMVKTSNTLGEALRTMMQTAMELIAPPNAAVSATSSKLFEEEGPPLRAGYRVVGSLTLGASSAKQTQIVVWTVNADSAANLNCARVDGNETPLLMEVAKAFKFKSANE